MSKRQRSWDVANAFEKRRKTGEASSMLKSKPRFQRQNAILTSRDVELKVADIAATTYQVNTTGSFTLLAAPVPGTDFTNRVGRKVELKSVYIRGFVFPEAAASQGVAIDTIMEQARLIVFVDKQPNGAVPVVADLLNTASTASMLNLNNRDRFRIIHDETFEFDPYYFSNTATQSYVSATNQIKPVKYFKKLNIRTIFNAGTAGTIADINSEALYMFWIGNAAAGTNTDVNATVSTRVRFTDY